ncbi:MAG: hypothetical protein CMJ81_03115 [Planctomycetaceae bacterium]|nr:hypothetical protein [Planctomycetaceae bacterium]MBP60183.1 hypothetical protein [Planctomycetaceae bacterium]
MRVKITPRRMDQSPVLFSAYFAGFLGCQRLWWSRLAEALQAESGLIFWYNLIGSRVPAFFP